MSSASAPPSEVSGPRQSEQETGPALSAMVRKGAVWSVLSTLLLRLANIAVTAVVAHILAPRDFGVFTVALTAYTVIASLNEFGIASCLIRADLDIEAMAPTMTTVSWVTSAISAAVMSLYAGKIAAGLGSSDGAGPLTVMSLALLVSGISAVPGAQLTRDFKQDKLFLANAISLIPSTAVLLFLAKSGSGAMAFAWSRVVAQFVTGLVTVASVPKFYIPGIDRDALSVLFRFGLPLAGANFVNFVLINVDYAFVGHLVGAVALGAYMLAYTIASAPGLLLGNVINSIAMPAFSRVKHDPDLLKNAMTSAMRVISLVLMPMCGIMIALARPIIFTVYGAKWAAAVHVLSILATYGAISIICVLFANMLTSLGKAKFTFIVQLVWLGALVPAMAIGVHRNGIVGAAIAHIAVIVPIVLPSYLVVLRRATGVHITGLVRAVLPSFAAASVASVAARVVATRLASPLAELVGGLAVGGLIYAAAIGPQALPLLGQERAARLQASRVFRPYYAMARLLRIPVAAPALAAADGQGEPKPTGWPGSTWAVSSPDSEQTAVLAFTSPYHNPWTDSRMDTVPMPRLDIGPAARPNQDKEAPKAAAAGHKRANAGGAQKRMSASAAVLGRELMLPRSVRVAERATRRGVEIAWGLLFLNALVFYGSVWHIPSALGKAITQGALPMGLLVALIINRRLLVRPNLFLCLVSLLAIEAVITTLQPQHLGNVYRTFRLAEFVIALWLLTPWWGRRDLLLVRGHLAALSAALGSVVLGVLVAPGHALSGHRLSGVLWVIPATEVAHYAAVTIGLVMVLWLCGKLSGKIALLVAVVEGAMLILTHTRTAAIGLVAGLLVAGLSLILTTSRVRRFFVTAGIVVAIGVVLAAGAATTWLARGQSTHELTSLTGRTDFWGLVLHLPRTRFQEIFGFGLSNGSVNGLPVDSNWLTSYLQQGLFGVAVSVAMILFLLVTVFFQPPGPNRALALFLIAYCLAASFTQVGFSSATIYLLDLTLAASLLVSPLAGRRPP
ncbi:MAG TPA: lipopolysaccharide biosynthesis protein [Streptosporangiaceae bacterium]